MQDLFVVEMGVRIRTLPPASAPMEIAVEAGLKSVRQNADALHREQAAGDAGAWAISIADLEESSRSLLEKWRHLDADSPFRGVVDEVRDLIAGAASTFDPDHVPPGLERELAQWVRASGSQWVARSLHEARARLGGISLRESARRSGIAAGHLSELEDGRGRMPTVSTARRLDAALETDVVGILASIRAALPARARGRPRSTEGRAQPAPTTSLDPRLDGLFARIAGDERLITVNEDLLSLSAGVRRGIVQMIRALAAEGRTGGARGDSSRS